MLDCRERTQSSSDTNNTADQREDITGGDVWATLAFEFSLGDLLEACTSHWGEIHKVWPVDVHTLVLEFSGISLKFARSTDKNPIKSGWQGGMPMCAP